MTTKQIEAKQAHESKKYEAAKAIRKLLDDLRKELGAEEYDGDDIETIVLEMVMEEVDD